MLQVLIVTQKEVLFNGPASQVIFPGERGIFEVNRFHRPLISRLLPGSIQVDQQVFSIRQGIVEVENDRVISLVEIPREGASRGS